MTAETDTLRQDLAFMRAVVAAGGDPNPAFGETYLAAGLIYGAQMLLHAAQFLGLAPSATPWPLLFGFGPTVVFIPVAVWIGVRHKPVRPNASGRAFAAVFGVVSTANLALICVIGSVAWREHSLTTWLIYPCAVFVLQGAAWLFGWLLRRRAWYALVAAGWFISGIAMALTVQSLGYFVLAGGLGIWLCMALPGWVMLRLARRGGP